MEFSAMFSRARLRAAGVVVAAGLAGAAKAEAPPQIDPPFHFVRHDDDFSFLANKPDPNLWERMKYIPLGSSLFGKAYLSLGGEVRERWEGYRNINYGLGKAAPGSGYLLQRLQFQADLHAGDWLRGFAMFGDNRIFSHRGATSTVDTDRLELYQRFVDLTPPSPFGDKPVLRYGRQEVSLGFQRLVALREGPNVHRDFDGWRIGDRLGSARVDFLQLQPVNNSPYAWDDVTNRHQRLSGVYATTPVIGPLKADLYYLAYENNAIKMRGLAGSEKAGAAGARLFGEAGGFDWNVEGAWQSGTFQTGARSYDVNAHLLAALAGYTFADLPWRPRIGFSANDASGDNSADKTTIGTFNPMFPRLPYFAETPILIPANVRDVRPIVRVEPLKGVDVYIGYDMLWRASTSDALYGSNFIALPNTAKATGSRIGSEISLDARWQVNTFLQLGGIIAQFQAGPALTSVGGKNMTYAVLFARLKY
jgi:hypothetical protein